MKTLKEFLKEAKKIIHDDELPYKKMPDTPTGQDLEKLRAIKLSATASNKQKDHAKKAIDHAAASINVSYNDSEGLKNKAKLALHAFKYAYHSNAAQK